MHLIDKIVKACSKCKVLKPLSGFAKLRQGYQSWCKECQNECHRNHNAKEDVKIRKAQYRKEYNSTDAAKKINAEYQRKIRSTEEEKIKRYCRRVAQLAVNSGKLVKKPCEQCGNPNAQKHHTDYSKPLEVRWLCRLCHMKLHQEKRETCTHIITHLAQ